MNPFKYGKVVSDPFFVNRKKELSEISLNLQSGNNLIIYAPRRYGKTSLIKKVLEEIEQIDGIITIYVDFFQVISQKKFIDLYTRKILQTKKISIEKSLSIFKKLVSGILPSITIDEFGKPVINFSYQHTADKEKTLIEVLELPEKLYDNKRLVVVFDEFQEITKLNGENFENQLRSVIQFHENVSYVFMGSQTHLLLNMFQDKKRAFYNIGKLMRIEKIPKNEIKTYLKDRFEKSGLKISNQILDSIINISDNIPYYTQFLAFEIWQLAFLENVKINEKILDKAIDKIINNQTDYYVELFEKISNYQKKLLLALIKENSNIFSKDFSEKYNMSSVSSTQRAVNRLIEIGIIEKIGNNFTFSDPLFKRFLKLRFDA
ncbi:MAG: ATP-binding protein [Candidatus Marinimicrobia bacterium]|nr:ATP-binding protein [Candidatus Neomarinimicrobiota bacterium]